MLVGTLYREVWAISRLLWTDCGWHFNGMYVSIHTLRNFSPANKYIIQFVAEFVHTSKWDKLTQVLIKGVVSHSCSCPWDGGQNINSYTSGMILKDWQKMNSTEMPTNNIPSLCSCRCSSVGCQLRNYEKEKACMSLWLVRLCVTDLMKYNPRIYVFV